MVSKSESKGRKLMNQRKAKTIRRMVKKQRKLIVNQFINQMADCSIWTRFKMALMIIRGKHKDVRSQGSRIR